MEIRELKPEEQIQYSGICQTVFFDLERRDIREMMKDPLKHVQDDEKMRFGAFDGEKLQSAMVVNPYTMRMNGKVVKMGGIGAVVTRPEARGKGNIRQIFEKAFPAMLEAGQIFSFLYPFSYAYYRKFGYEMCLQRNSVRIPISEFSGYRYPQNFTPYEPGDSIAPFEDIYENFARNRNLSFVRNYDDWERILKRDPYKNLEFTYLHHAPQGNADGYILYGGEVNNTEGNIIKIKECCWNTPEALHGILGFLSKMGAEYEYVDWEVPNDVNIYAMLPDGYSPQYRVNPSGMNRILNVQAALETLHPPENGGVTPNGGVVTIGVTDTFFPVNSGQYEIQWNCEHLAVQKLATGKTTPDMETSIETLTQLVTGFTSTEEALYKQDTKLNDKYALTELIALFPKQKLYMMESF